MLWYVAWNKTVTWNMFWGVYTVKHVAWHTCHATWVLVNPPKIYTSINDTKQWDKKVSAKSVLRLLCQDRQSISVWQQFLYTSRAPDRGVIEDNSMIIFLISQQKHMLWPLNETVLMMGHKICFYGEIWPIILKLSMLPLLIWSTDLYTVQATSTDLKISWFMLLRYKG